MRGIGKSIITLTVIVLIHLLVYITIIKPKISTWGASDPEVQMNLPGDSLAPFTGSTRAISINAPKQEVWSWLIQLGADRAGWFSYTFLEKMMGYHTKEQNRTIPEDYNFEVGRIIPGTVGDSKSLLDYNFPVVYVNPGNSFVLENWGTLYIYALDQNNTRLVIRTNGFESADLVDKVAEFIMFPLHYLMERRMMMGIKACAENGADARYSSISDLLWFCGVVLSALGIIVMIFLDRSWRGNTLSSVYSLTWLWVLLVFNPHPLSSNLQLLTVSLTITWFLLRRTKHISATV